MCGACGNYSAKDWSWPWLADSRSATLIARAAERLSRVHGIRIIPAPNGWQVSMPTGLTKLVSSVVELARVAQVDATTSPEVSLAESAETSIVDRRRPVTVTFAQPGELPTAAFADTLLSSETTAVTIDGASLRALHDLAHTASLAPYRDHIRLLPIAPEMMHGVVHHVVVHRWAGLPEAIGLADLPALCLSLAARLVALPTTDTNFREARIRCGENGTVHIQSVGSTVTAMDVTATSHFA